MRVDFRLSSFAILVWLAACGSTQEPLGDERPFVGNYRFSEGLVQATCGDAIAAHDPTGRDLTIRELAPGKIAVEAGIDCVLDLEIRSRVARTPATSACLLAIESVTLDANFDEFRLEPAPDDALLVRGSGTAALRIDEQTLECAPFELRGTVARQGDR